jgi:hypothetical protein
VTSDDVGSFGTQVLKRAPGLSVLKGNSLKGIMTFKDIRNILPYETHTKLVPVLMRISYCSTNDPKRDPKRIIIESIQ